MSKPLSLKELRAIPATQNLPAYPDATKKGVIKVGASRNCRAEISYRTHGHGPIKILWLPGHGQTMYGWGLMPFHEFGNDKADEYTSLFIDNRGIGESTTSWCYITPKMMAYDVLEVLDNLQWTDAKSINILGFSMGGFISQEFALLAPERIRTLTLVNTTSNTRSELGFFEAQSIWTPFVTALTEDARTAIVVSRNISDEWARTPDASGEYPTQGDRWTAEMFCRNYDKEPNMKGAALVLAGISMFKLSSEQLKIIGDAIGRENILIIQGTGDKTLPPKRCQCMVDAYGWPDSGVKRRVCQGANHCIVAERWEHVSNDLISHFKKPAS